MTKRNSNKYYRIIEDSVRYPSKKEELNGLKDLITTLAAHHQYIYIDINECTA